MNRFMMLMLFVSLLVCTNSFAKDIYVSLSGSDTITYSENSIGSPFRTIGKAFSEVISGDQILVRGGSYEIVDFLETAVNNVSLESYQDESVEISGDGLSRIIEIENTDWTIDGISMSMTNALGALIFVGYNGDGSGITIKNCKLTIVNSVGASNIACIVLQADRSNNALIQDNIITGQGTSDAENLNHGVQYLGGGNTGTKILNNEITGCSRAVYVKHANGDTSIGAAEISNNYMHDNTHGFYGNPVFVTFHNNISDEINLGNNGGGDQGHDNLITHNTLINKGISLQSPSEGPIRNCTIRDNIFPTKYTATYNGDTEQLNTWDYNIYFNDAAIGAQDIGNSIPTYVGGFSPSSTLGFELAVGGIGFNSASSGTNIGADVTNFSIAIAAPEDFSKESL